MCIKASESTNGYSRHSTVWVNVSRLCVPKLQNLLMVTQFFICNFFFYRILLNSFMLKRFSPWGNNLFSKITSLLLLGNKPILCALADKESYLFKKFKKYFRLQHVSLSLKRFLRKVFLSISILNSLYSSANREENSGVLSG